MPVAQVMSDKSTVSISNSVSVNGITYIQDYCVISIIIINVYFIILDYIDGQLRLHY